MKTLIQVCGFALVAAGTCALATPAASKTETPQVRPMPLERIAVPATLPSGETKTQRPSLWEDSQADGKESLVTNCGLFGRRGTPSFADSPCPGGKCQVSSALTSPVVASKPADDLAAAPVIDGPPKPPAETKKAAPAPAAVQQVTSYSTSTVSETHSYQAEPLYGLAAAAHRGHERRAERREHRHERRHARRCG